MVEPWPQVGEACRWLFRQVCLWYPLRAHHVHRAYFMPRAVLCSSHTPVRFSLIPLMWILPLFNRQENWRAEWLSVLSRVARLGSRQVRIQAQLSSRSVLLITARHWLSTARGKEGARLRKQWQKSRFTGNLLSTGRVLYFTYLFYCSVFQISDFEKFQTCKKVAAIV